MGQFNNKISRRKLLQVGSATASLMAMPFIMTKRADAAPTQLNILSWYGHAEPEMVAEFEKLHNVKINKKYYVGGDQMLAALAQSPVGTFDVILSDREYVEQLVAADMVEKLDPSDYPISDYFSEFQKFPGHWKDGDLYSLLIRFGYLGLSYNTDTFSKKDVESYEAMWSENVRGKVGHFDWHLPNFGAVSLLQGNNNPFDLQDAAWQKVQNKTFSLKPQVAGFFDYGGVLSSLRSGQVNMIPGIGDWITGVLQRDGAKVDTIIPREGGLLWAESLSIGKGSRQADLAKKFINYVLSPAGQVRTATLKAYPALLPTEAGWKALQKANPAEAARQGMVSGQSNALDLYSNGNIKLRALPVQQSLEDWNDAWSNYKNL